MAAATRREVLVTIAAGLSAGSLPGQTVYAPTTLSAEEYRLLGILTEMIIPASDTPGALGAGVPRILDEDLSQRSEPLATLRGGFAKLREEGFEAMTAAERISTLTRYSEASDADREFFRTLKGLTVDAYYSTEAGLVQELGYQGNTYLAEFPGCTHKHELAERA